MPYRQGIDSSTPVEQGLTRAETFARNETLERLPPEEECRSLGQIFGHIFARRRVTPPAAANPLPVSEKQLRRNLQIAQHRVGLESINTALTGYLPEMRGESR